MVHGDIHAENEQIAGSYGKLSVKELYAIHYCNYLFENKILCNIISLCYSNAAQDSSSLNHSHLEHILVN